MDGGVNLAMEKGREHVQKMHSDERVQVRGKRGAGDRRSAAGVEVYRRRQCGSSSSKTSSLVAIFLGFLDGGDAGKVENI